MLKILNISTHKSIFPFLPLPTWPLKSSRWSVESFQDLAQTLQPSTKACDMVRCLCIPNGQSLNPCDICGESTTDIQPLWGHLFPQPFLCSDEELKRTSLQCWMVIILMAIPTQLLEASFQKGPLSHYSRHGTCFCRSKKVIKYTKRKGKKCIWQESITKN